MTHTKLPQMTLEQAIDYAKTSDGVRFLLTPDLIAVLQRYARKSTTMLIIPNFAKAATIVKRKDGVLEIDYWYCLDLSWVGCDLPQIELVVSKPEPKKHPLAELMLQYAKDAMETDKPWESWEVNMGSCPEDYWTSLYSHPVWDSKNKYRRKPKTININGFEVPEPLREIPKEKTTVYYVDLIYSEGVTEYVYYPDLEERSYIIKAGLPLGIVHLTKEAAELHAKALLSFTNLTKESYNV